MKYIKNDTFYFWFYNLLLKQLHSCCVPCRGPGGVGGGLAVGVVMGHGSSGLFTAQQCS